MQHTSNDDIQDQDDQTDYATSAAIFPCVLLDGDGSSHGESEEGELEEETECGGQHLDGLIFGRFV